MKIVLSRKGFDAGNGGVPSPILPDGRLISFPIPVGRDPHTFDDVTVDDVDVGAMVEQLTDGRYTGSSHIHLDPYLRGKECAQIPGWRPALGQTGIAQSHLAAQGVGAGDVMLFFGWFRAVEPYRDRWRYRPRAPDLHVLFGWIEIEAVLALGAAIRLFLNVGPTVTCITVRRGEFHHHREGIELPVYCCFFVAATEWGPPKRP